MWDIKFSKNLTNEPSGDGFAWFEKKHYLWSNPTNNNIPTPELNIIRNTYDGYSRA